MASHEIGEVSDFPEDRGTAINVEGRSIAVFRIDGEFFAVQNNCPHKNLPLHLAGHEAIASERMKGERPKRGNIYDGCKIDCPWHQAEWDLKTGHSPVVKKAIATYDIEVKNETVLLHI